MTLPRGARRIPKSLNRFVLPLIARRAPMAIVRHRGRRTGQSYENPVLAVGENTRWVITLPYGPDVNWVRNAMAARHADLVQAGVTHQGLSVRMISAEEGATMVPRSMRVLMRVLGVRNCLVLAA